MNRLRWYYAATHCTVTTCEQYCLLLAEVCSSLDSLLSVLFKHSSRVWVRKLVKNWNLSNCTPLFYFDGLVCTSDHDFEINSLERVQPGLKEMDNINLEKIRLILKITLSYLFRSELHVLCKFEQIQSSCFCTSFGSTQQQYGFRQNFFITSIWA